MSAILIARVLIMGVFMLVVGFGLSGKIKKLIRKILKREEPLEEW